MAKRPVDREALRCQTLQRAEREARSTRPVNLRDRILKEEAGRSGDAIRQNDADPETERKIAELWPAPKGGRHG